MACRLSPAPASQDQKQFRQKTGRKNFRTRRVQNLTGVQGAGGTRESRSSQCSEHSCCDQCDSITQMPITTEIFLMLSSINTRFRLCAAHASPILLLTPLRQFIERAVRGLQASSDAASEHFAGGENSVRHAETGDPSAPRKLAARGRDQDRITETVT